jgi:hypothetical protein
MSLPGDQVMPDATMMALLSARWLPLLNRTIL